MDSPNSTIEAYQYATQGSRLPGIHTLRSIFGKEWTQDTAWRCALHWRVVDGVHEGRYTHDIGEENELLTDRGTSLPNFGQEFDGFHPFFGGDTILDNMSGLIVSYDTHLPSLVYKCMKMRDQVLHNEFHSPKREHHEPRYHTPNSIGTHSSGTRSKSLSRFCVINSGLSGYC